MSNPLFTLIHPSARPDKWCATYNAWMQFAAYPEQIQYILCVDQDGPFGITKGGLPLWGRFDSEGNPLDTTAVNAARKCNVDASNIGARYATGRILVWIADDMFPPEGWWDLAIMAAIHSRGLVVSDEFVLEVDTGTPTEHERRILPMPIMSRKRYERLGYFYYPEYLGMYADNDLFEAATLEGCLIDCRDTLHFEHRHPFFTPGVQTDDVYEWHNRDEAYAKGKEIFRRRQAAGFPATVEASQKAPNPPGVKAVIHLLCPGEMFSGRWVFVHIIPLIDKLRMNGYAVVPHNYFCSDVVSTRNTLAERALCIPQGDYCLWIDDDNLVTGDQALQLIKALEDHPEAGVVAGWTWIQTDFESVDARISCGIFNGNGTCEFPESFTIEGEPELAEFEWTGFPVVAMRREALTKAGPDPFEKMPLTTPDGRKHRYGEDVSFCMRLRKAGGRVFVDPSVYVPHLKLREALPLPKTVAMPDVDDQKFALGVTHRQRKENLARQEVKA